MNDKLDTVVDYFHSNDSNSRNDERVDNILVPKQRNENVFKVAVIDFTIEAFGIDYQLEGITWEEMRAIIKADVADKELLDFLNDVYEMALEEVEFDLPIGYDLVIEDNQLIERAI